MQRNGQPDPDTRRGCDNTESRSPTLFAVRRGWSSGATETQSDLSGSGKLDSSGTDTKRSYDQQRRLPHQTYCSPARVLAGTATGILASRIRSPAESLPLVSKFDAAAFTLVFFGIQSRVLLSSCSSTERALFPQLR